MNDPPSPPSYSPVISQQSLKAHAPQDSRAEPVNGEGIVQTILDISGNERNVSQSPSMLRPAHARPLLSHDLSNRLSDLSTAVVSGLHNLLFFPDSFTAESALAVVAPDYQSSVPNFATCFLQPLENANVLEQLASGRYALNAAAKSVLPKPSATSNVQTAHRFVSHFIEQLRALENQTLCTRGKQRIQAMRLYDAERANMEAALDLSHEAGGHALAVDFLAQAATVMRYSTAASSRMRIFASTLESNDGKGGNEEAETRVRLGLGEALLDRLQFEAAGIHIGSAIHSLAGRDSSRSSVAIMSSVLALLLLAELRVADGLLVEASRLLAQALCSLQDASLQRSTFAVCSLLTLASVYTSMNDEKRAKDVVQTALEILNDLGFERMPIYADALRTLGDAHLSGGETGEAQKLFLSGLSIFESWVSQSDWESTPYQDCLHLDIFLFEGIAQTYVVQQREDEANKLLQRAQRLRKERELEIGTSGQNRERLFTRHLY